MILSHYNLEFRTTARRRFTEFVFSRTDSSLHIVWGCFSVYFQDLNRSVIRYCGECDSDALRGLSAGDESWEVCDACQSIEPSTYERTYMEVYEQTGSLP